MTVQRGEIDFVNLNPVEGREQAGQPDERARECGGQWAAAGNGLSVFPASFA